MPTFEQEIVREARTLARLQLQRRDLRSRVRAIEKQMRASKRLLSKLVGAMTDIDQLPPLKVFGE